MLKKAKIAFLLLFALVFALQGAGMETALAAREKWNADRMTYESLQEYIGPISPYGVVAEEYIQLDHSEANVYADEVIRNAGRDMDRIPFLASGDTQETMKNFQVQCTVELPEIHLADELTFGLYTKEGNTYVPTGITTTVNVENKTSVELDFGRITRQDLMKTALYVFQVEDNTYIAENEKNNDGMQVKYGPAVITGNFSSFYLGSLSKPNGLSEYDAYEIFQEEGIYHQMILGEEVRLFRRDGTPLPDGQPADEVLINDKDWGENVRYKVKHLTYDGENFLVYGQQVLEVVYLDTLHSAYQQLQRLSDLSYNLANSDLNVREGRETRLGGRVDGNPGDAPKAEGNSTVKGTLVDGTVVSLYHVDTTDQGDYYQLDMSSINPWGTRGAEWQNKGLPIADNEYIVMNVLVPSKDGILDIDGSNALSLMTTDGQKTATVGSWRAGDTEAFSRIIWNPVYYDERTRKYEAFEGTVIVGDHHGGLVLVPEGDIVVEGTSAEAVVLVGRSVTNKKEIHQTSFATNRTFVEMENAKETINLRGEKKWSGEDMWGSYYRPSSITVKLLANGVVKDTFTVTPDRRGNWTWEVKDLPKYINDGELVEYTFEELPVANYPSPSVSASGKDNEHITITNTLEMWQTGIAVQKEWDDNDDQDGIRPSKVTVYLEKQEGWYSYGYQMATSDWVKVEGSEREISKATNWACTYEKLSTYDWSNNHFIRYRVREVEVPGYTAVLPEISGDNWYDQPTVQTITNKHVPETVQISGTKTWYDNGNNQWTRPNEVTINLLADGEVADSIQVVKKDLDTNDTWTWAFTDLPKYSDGQEIAYSVEELSVNGYTTYYTEQETDAGQQIDIVNSLRTVQINGSKTWSGGEKYASQRPDTLYFDIYRAVYEDEESASDNDAANDEKVSTVTVSKSWDGTYSNWISEKLAEYGPDGKKAEYYVVERDIPNYAASYQGNGTLNVAVTNTYTGIDVKADKVWDGGSVSSRPQTIMLRVQQSTDGSNWSNAQWEENAWTKYDLTYELNVAGGETSHTFEDLPQYTADGKKLEYRVIEDAVPGYVVSYETVTDAATGHVTTTITNTSDGPETISISGTKVWKNENGDTSRRPAEGVTISLWNDANANGTGDEGELVETKTVTAATAADDNTWSWSFDDLDKVDQKGNEIKYLVTENAVAGYDKAEKANADGTWTIENTYIADASLSFKGTKSLTGKTLTAGQFSFVLQKDGVEQETVQNAADGSFAFAPVAVTYADIGKTLTFTIDEVDDGQAGVAYDSTVHTIKVKVEGNGAGGLVLTYPEGEALYHNGVTFANSYEQPKASAVLSGVKRLDGAASSQAFTLELYQADGTTLIESVQSGSDGSFAFAAQEYTKDGTYTYIIKEKNAGQVVNGIEYSSMQFKAVVMVTLNADGSLTASAPVYTQKDKDADDSAYTAVTAMSFENRSVTDITVTKTWADENDKDGIRPDSITVNLLADGASTGKSLELNESSQWTGGWTDLPVYANGSKIAYSVEEVKVGGYAAVITGDAAQGFQITNTLAQGDFELDVYKTLVNADKLADGEKRTFTFNLYELLKDAEGKDVKGSLVGSTSIDITNGTADGTAKGTISFPLKYGENNYLLEEAPGTDTDVSYETDKKYKLMVYALVGRPGDEYEGELVPEKFALYDYATGAAYEASVDPVFTNTYIAPAEVAIKAAKTLEGAVLQAGQFTFQLKEGDTVLQTRSNAADGSITFDAIPYTKADLGDASSKTFTYTIVEVDDGKPGYTYDSAVQTVTVQVMQSADTKQLTAQVTYGSANGAAFVNQYTAKGSTVLGFTKTLTNGEKLQDVREFSFKLVDNTTGETVDTQSVKVSKDSYQDVAGAFKTIDYTKAGSYEYTISEIAGSDGDVQYASASYLVKVSVTDDGMGSLTAKSEIYALPVAAGDQPVEGAEFINTLGFTSVKGTKTWDDNSDQDGLRPEKITVNLLANGQKVASKEVTGTGDAWTYEFTDLLMYQNGQKIIYTITEDPVENYEIIDADNGIDLTNRYAPGKVVVNGLKTWNDEGNRDGLRPASITIRLYADGVEIRSLEVTEADKWAWSFADLDEYADGEKIQYTISEDEVPGYTSVVDGYSVTNTYKAEETEISVTKVWEDKADQDKKRPASITVNLLADGAKVDAIELSESNQWKHTFTGLAKNRYDAAAQKSVAVQYTVEEDAVTDYEANITGDMTSGYTITNTYETAKTSVSVTKGWEDGDNADGLRPEKITVNLLADGVKAASAELSEANGWSYTFADLDEKKAGTAIAYTVEEVSVEGYTGKITGNAKDGYTITNTHETEKTEISVTKVWEDKDDQDKKRPASITVNLLADGAKVDSIELSESNQWKHTWTGLAKNADGEEIVYTVKEVASDELSVYQVSVTGNAKDGFTITNTYVPGKTSVSVTKAWEDGDNADGLRPEKITVNLLADGVKAASAELSEANGWSYTFADLDEKKAGEAIAYTVEEVSVEGYTGEITGNAKDGYTITNTHETEKTEISVTKVWEDKADQDKKRPASITVNLLADGAQVGSIELSESNQWQHTWTGLAKNADGEEIVYTVKEVATDELSVYQVSVTGNAKDGFTITNTYAPGKTSVSVTKDWEDGDNADGLRPEKITVNLLADGVKAASAELSEANGWSYTFADLDEKKAGEAIAYTVEEVSVEGYTGEITGNAKDGYTITNTHETEKTEISVTKVWEDKDNQDGKRTASVTVQLLANGESQGAAVTLDETNGWSYTWKELDAKKNGTPIAYTVVETNVPAGYTASITGSAKDGYTITNSYAPGTTGLTVQKSWDDADNVDGLRPAGIEVQLKADGVSRGEPVTLNEANAWTYTWSGLPQMANGKTIAYDVEEVNVPEGYTVSYRQSTDADNTIIVFNSREQTTIDISGTKTWADDSDKLGKRPGEITINLLADGVKVDSAKVNGTGDTWSYKFSGLKKNKLVNGVSTPIVYTVEEEPVENYQTEIDGYSITNTCTYKASGALTLVGSKKLTGSVLQVAENTFTFGVYKTDKNGNEVQVASGYNQADGDIVFDAIQYTLDDIGASYMYTVKEVAGLAADDTYNYTYDDTIYTIMVSVSDGGDGQLQVDESVYIGASLAQDGIVFTNAIVQKVGDLGVMKVDGKDTSKGLAGAVFTVYRDAACTSKVGYMTTDDKGIGTLKDLPIGTYYVVETTAPDGYLKNDTLYTVKVVEGDMTMVNGGMVPNTKLARLELEKSDRTNPDKKLPGAEYTLYTDPDCEEKDKYAVIVTGENGVGALDGVPPGIYWVKETKAPAGYEVDPTPYEVEVAVADDPDKPVFVQVSDWPLRGALTLSKQVVANTDVTDSFLFDIELSIDTDDKLAGSYEATLNGTETDAVIFTETETGAKATVSLKDGEIMAIRGLRTGVTYTVTEQENNRYDVQVNGAEASTATGTIKENAVSVVEYQNTLRLTGFQIEKVWLGAAGGEIELTLYAGGVAVDPQPAYTKEGNIYTYEDLLLMDESGAEIVYTVKETAMDGYATTYENAEPYAGSTDCAYNGGKIINQELTSFSVKKEWTGLADGEKAPAIQLTLYCNGEIYFQDTPAPDANGWYVYTDLPALVNGEEAVYTVVEEALSGYTTAYENKGEHAAETECAYNGGTIVNSKIPQTGDGMPLALWMTTMLLAALGLTGLMVYSRKREN